MAAGKRNVYFYTFIRPILFHSWVICFCILTYWAQDLPTQKSNRIVCKHAYLCKICIRKQANSLSFRASSISGCLLLHSLTSISLQNPSQCHPHPLYYLHFLLRPNLPLCLVTCLAYILCFVKVDFVFGLMEDPEANLKWLQTTGDCVAASLSLGKDKDASLAHLPWNILHASHRLLLL